MDGAKRYAGVTGQKLREFRAVKSESFMGMATMRYAMILLMWFAGVCAGEAQPVAQLIEPGQDAPKTITVQAAPPNVTVQAAPAPNVTVQAPAAPNVTVQAAPAPQVTVQAPPAANVHVDGATIDATPKTDWTALWVQIGAAIGTIVGSLKVLAGILRKHRQNSTDESDWTDLLSYAYQFAKGDGPERLKNAFELARARFQKRYGGEMSAQDEIDAEHGLAALHLEAVGPLEHDATEELKKEEAALKQKLSLVQAKIGVVAVMFALLLTAGCNVTTHGDQLREDIAKSAAGVKTAYANVVDTFVNYYVANENARIDAIHEAAVASHDAPTGAKIAAVTQNIKLADGTTVKSGDPAAVAAILEGKAKIIAALEKQRQANYAQVQRVAASMRTKLMNTAIDIDHVIALTEGLKQYFATRTNVEATINASADEVLRLATEFIPVPAPKSTTKK